MAAVQSQTFGFLREFPNQDVKSNMKHVQSAATIATTAGSDASVEQVEIDGVMVAVHEDLKELYSDEATLTRLMRLRQTPMGTFADCGDIHSLDGWGTKGEAPTIRMQLERGAITLDDTLQKVGQPGNEQARKRVTIAPAVQVSAPSAQSVAPDSSKPSDEPLVWPCLGVEYFVVNGQLKERPIQVA